MVEKFLILTPSRTIAQVSFIFEKRWGIKWRNTHRHGNYWIIPGGGCFTAPGCCRIEGWLGRRPLSIHNLNPGLLFWSGNPRSMEFHTFLTALAGNFDIWGEGKSLRFDRLMWTWNTTDFILFGQSYFCGVGDPEISTRKYLTGVVEQLFLLYDVIRLMSDCRKWLHSCNPNS